MLKAITLSGSIRQNSHNGRLAQLMTAKLSAAGADVLPIDLGAFELPLFNADLESELGQPEAAIILANHFAGSDMVFIASPEYNGSLSPLLKNTIDWISRQKTTPFDNAVFGIGAASPGKMAGISGLGHLRDILGKLGALVAPVTLGIGNAQSAFDQNGQLSNPAANRRADLLVSQLMNISHIPK
ncbi:hypothetical protein MNBD_ALPHA12-683 [hydrothermal vent metagenome]|uniref:NADPH-dependent FMN reductase-like domain-containing protein n=1 Tax=hydrothermal vent metagenome TaxID=652676 RepID=A0A3B0TPE6_9ZZZZ